MLEIFNDVPNISCLTEKSKTTLKKFQYCKKKSNKDSKISCKLLK